ncbi:hypothetical protein [Clavibacter sp. CFBP 8614]|uniref:hypothetical protein n=1 Tax=unclassified Clavibacter TaxID=2626594 RepID=UPI004040EBBA
MSASPFVPAGPSVWEMGVTTDPKKKADKDYAKRTNDPLGVDRSATTFVFVTPRLWPGAEKWASERRAEGAWKDVVVRDAVAVHSAMIEVPSLHVYFSELIGMPANGVRTLADWWRRYTKRVDDRLPSRLLLVGREEASRELIRILSHEPKAHIYIDAVSIDDVIGFVAATLIDAAQKGHPEHLEGALVVFEPGAMLYLGDHEDLLILIPFAESLIREAELASGNSVIIRVETGSRSNISLPQLPIQQVQQMLAAEGVAGTETRTLAVAAYRSLPLLRATLLGELTVGSSATSQALAEMPKLRRVWMLGGWNSERTGDKNVLEDVLGTAFDDSLLTSTTLTADPVFTRVGSSWRVIAPDIHVASVGSRLTTDDVDALERAIQSVLGAVDPTLQIGASERWRADTVGPGRLHSKDLRTGIATTLAAFGSLGEDVSLGSGTLRGWTELVVRATLERAHNDLSGALWLSLVDLLPLFAEAAPDEVMVALSRELDRNGPLKERMFNESDDLFSATSPHVFVLWALETLAWSEDYFAEVAHLIARLAALDPGGKSGNRPSRSLESIFLPWMPHTAANVDQRADALRSLLRRHK